LGTQNRQFFDTLDDLSLSPGSLPEIVASTSFLAGTRTRGATMVMMVSHSRPRRQGIPMAPPLAVSMLCYSLADIDLTYFKVGTLLELALTLAKIVLSLPKMVPLLVWRLSLVTVPHY
jgi:hypothetical protein